jgi:hypothetical protein
MPIMKITDIKKVDIADDGSVVVLKTAAVFEDQRTELEIAITTDLAPQVAIALLATTAKARAARDGLEPALDVLAAAVVACGFAEKVRLHLLLHSGSVLPVELPKEAAGALTRALVEDIAIKDSRRDGATGLNS